MKKLTLSLILITLLTTTAILFASPFSKDTTLNAEEVKKKWGETSIDYVRFKTGDLKIKSQMAYSILKDKSLIGQHVKYIRANFGSPDGFYFIDVYPAYIIQEGQNRAEETWQIVFKLNENAKVREVVVHKNCCD